MKKIIIILIFVCSGIAYLQAQDTVNFKSAVSIVPHTLFVNGLRFDIDKRIVKPNIWLTFAPQIYFAKRNTTSTDVKDDRSFYDLKGAGIETNLRLYIGKLSSNSATFYISGGVLYHYFDITYPDENYVEVINISGLPVMEYSKVRVNNKINKLGLNITIGITYTAKQGFFIEPFLGYGIRYSDIKSDTKIESTKFRNTWIDYGYSGVVLTGGIRFGILY